MTNATTNVNPRPARLRQAVHVGGLALLGGVVGYLVARMDTGDRIQQLGAVQAITLAAAVGLCLAGLVIFLLSFNRKALARLDSQSDGPATPGEARMMRWSGLVLVLSAVLAATPLLTRLVYETVPPRAGAFIIAALIVGTVVHAAMNLMVWRRADEFTRRVSLEAAALAFLLFEAGFFIWAAAELLGVAPAISAWTLWTVMFGLYLLVAIYVSLKRGMR